MGGRLASTVVNKLAQWGKQRQQSKKKTTFISEDEWKFVKQSDHLVQCRVFSYQIPCRKCSELKIAKDLSLILFPKEPQLCQKKCWHHYCASHSTTMDCIKMQDALRRRGRSAHFNSINHIFHLWSAGQGRFHQGFNNNFGGWTARHQLLLKIDSDLAILFVSRQTTDQIQIWLLVKFQKCLFFLISGTPSLPPQLFPWSEQSQGTCLASCLQRPRELASGGPRV